jgi:hypothetical protein
MYSGLLQTVTIGKLNVRHVSGYFLRHKTNLKANWPWLELSKKRLDSRIRY